MNNKYQTAIKIIVIIVIMMVIFKACLIFLWPFMASVLLVFIVEPIVKMMMQLNIGRKGSVIISYMIAFLALLLLSCVLSKYIYLQLTGFMQNAASILDVISKTYNYPPLNMINYDNMAATVQKLLLSYKSGIVSTVLSTFNGFMNLVVTIMCSIFISLDYDKLVVITARLLPSRVFLLLSRICKKLGKFIKLQLQLILMTTIQTVVGLYILGINNALTIGIICGILDLLPIVGPAIVFIPLTIYEYSINKPVTGTGLILLYILLQVIREVLKIKLVGDKLDVHPLVTVICLYYGLYLYGIAGLILGPILIVIIMELYSEYAGRSRLP